MVAAGPSDFQEVERDGMDEDVLAGQYGEPIERLAQIVFMTAAKAHRSDLHHDSWMAARRQYTDWKKLILRGQAEALGANDIVARIDNE